ncbi:hypothetical protein Cgig2_025650 [Carnegiea gigantea]|uniref:Helicase ATP-binding domain-containing protein n=1 Tax=Carnegiea gigantea TaxID=171969 RepID=A0A9Q1Q7C7_9CARY|nr:hypothetical protein Cgig2_025650 [Carnegiea gigantea]
MPEDNGTKTDSSDSPTSVLDEGNAKDGVDVKLEDDAVIDLKNGDSTLISKAMAEEDEKLLEDRGKEEHAKREKLPKDAANLNESQFSKLHELLTQTQLYSEFLLEKMDDVTLNGVENQGEEPSKGEKKGWGAKRLGFCTKKAMLTTSQGTAVEDAKLTKEEGAAKQQAEVIPLLTGGQEDYSIGSIAHLKGKGLDGPSMVIAPLSTLSNWVNEITRFVPSMKAIIYHGDKQRCEIRLSHMPKKIHSNFPIVVTFYEVDLSDARKHLRHYKWKYAVVDEVNLQKQCQRLLSCSACGDLTFLNFWFDDSYLCFSFLEPPSENSNCKLLKELKLLPIGNKFLLAGTPLQNNLAEQWLLLSFILPDIFSSREEFESWFDLSRKCSNEAMREKLEEKRRVQVVAKLHAILCPSLLRRMKADVELMFPCKKDIVLYATMTGHQKNFQERLVNKTVENYFVENISCEIAGPTPHGMKGKLNNLMVHLLKNCNHPDPLESAFIGLYYCTVEQCGKFRLLDRLLTQLFAQKHKVSFRSSYVLCGRKVLDIMDYYFSEKWFKVCRIDGNVKLDEKRGQHCRIFLLSTRTGGLGVNLAAADACIVYDSDRGRILKRAFSKLKLEQVIGQGQFKQERTRNDGMEFGASVVIFLLFHDGAKLRRKSCLLLEDDSEDKMVQTDISDEDLEKVLGCSDLVNNASDDEDPKTEKFVLPLKGPGWEVAYRLQLEACLVEMKMTTRSTLREQPFRDHQNRYHLLVSLSLSLYLPRPFASDVCGELRNSIVRCVAFPDFEFYVSGGKCSMEM